MKCSIELLLLFKVLLVFLGGYHPSIPNEDVSLCPTADVRHLFLWLGVLQAR